MWCDLGLYQSELTCQLLLDGKHPCVVSRFARTRIRERAPIAFENRITKTE